MNSSENNFNAVVSWIVGGFLCLLIVFGMANQAEPQIIKPATEECQDPEKLDFKNKKAYYELKELLKEIKGVDVNIRCKKYSGYLVRYISEGKVVIRENN